MTDRGFVSIEFVLASAMCLFLFVILANLLVVQYGLAAVEASLNQAVRAGTVSGSIQACERKASEVMDGLLGGSMGRQVLVRCASSGETMSATAAVVFDSWTPLQPPFHFEVVARGFIEHSR